MSSNFPPTKPPPRHVAIIMDGNGRWANERGLSREKGHKAGVENVRKIVEHARKWDIKHLTLYAFSVENWNRPKAEVKALMMLLESFLKAELKTLLERKIRFAPIGRIDELPKSVSKLIHKAIEETKDFDEYTLSLALNYGSRTEILDAVESITKAVKEDSNFPEKLNWEQFKQYLYTGNDPEPDLIIRTSGEYRISNFLLLQSAYAEYYFSKLFWPDFGPTAFDEAIGDYQTRERRYGMTSDQLKTQLL